MSLPTVCRAYRAWSHSKRSGSEDNLFALTAFQAWYIDRKLCMTHSWQEPPPPNRIADLLSHGKRPLRLTRPQGAFPEKREVRKNHFRFRRSEASLHLHGYYNAFSQNCKFYFVKYILSAPNLRAIICLYCMFVNILCFLLLFPWLFFELGYSIGK